MLVPSDACLITVPFHSISHVLQHPVICWKLVIVTHHSGHCRIGSMGMYCIVTNLQPPSFRPLLTLLHTSAALENWETGTPPKHHYIHRLTRCAQTCVIGCTHPLRCWPQGAVPTISISCTAAHVCGLSQLRNNYSTLASLYLRISKTCASVRNRTCAPALLLLPGCSPLHHFCPLHCCTHLQP